MAVRITRTIVLYADPRCARIDRNRDGVRQRFLIDGIRAAGEIHRCATCRRGRPEIITGSGSVLVAGAGMVMLRIAYVMRMRRQFGYRQRVTV